MRWRYILPGGRSPFGYSHRRRKPLRKQLDFGPGRNAAIRLGCLIYAMAMMVALLVVKVATHQ